MSELQLTGSDAVLTRSRILIVDDERVNIEILLRALQRGGYTNVVWTTEPQKAETLFRSQRPDLVLLDLHMPGVDGFEVMERITPEIGPENFVPIVILTADSSSAAKSRALSRGAKDFLTKPLDLVEVMLRIRNLLELRFLYLELRGQNAALERKVTDRTRELEEAQTEVIDRLARVAEFRDPTTGLHTRRVGELSALLARKLDLPEEVVELIRKAAPLHDIGKISLSDAVLLKPGKLSREEAEINQAHTTVGANLLSGGHFPLMRLAEEIALTHHERWDGGGYPNGLRGEEIPLAGRIVAVADVFDALTHERPYKRAWSVEDAAAELERQRGCQFDPRVIDAMLSILRSGAIDEVWRRLESSGEANVSPAATGGRCPLCGQNRADAEPVRDRAD